MPGFGTIERERILAEDELFVVARDKYPISPGHSLVIVKRVVTRFQELTADEKTRLLTLVDWCVAHLERSLEPKPDGFNVGLNDGAAAGQTARARPHATAPLRTRRPPHGHPDSTLTPSATPRARVRLLRSS